MEGRAFFRFLGIHTLVGAVSGWAIAGLFIAFDVASVGTLIMGSSTGMLAGFMLAFFFGLTFASVQVTLAVLQLGDKDDGPGLLDRLKEAIGRLVDVGEPEPRLVPIPVRSRPSRRGR